METKILNHTNCVKRAFIIMFKTMKLSRVNSDKLDELVKYYIERPSGELQSIIPKWAYAKDSDNMLNLRLHPNAGEYLIFLVDTKALIKTVEFGEVNMKTLFTGDKLNDSRVAKILYHWDNNQFIDPPIVEIFASTSKLGLSDGRHRSKTNYLLGHIQIPIAIHKSQIDRVSKILRLIPI